MTPLIHSSESPAFSQIANVVRQSVIAVAIGYNRDRDIDVPPISWRYG